MSRAILNITMLNLCWFACVLGAAWGYPLAGISITLAWVGVHLVLSRERLQREMTIIASAGVLGYILDSALVLLRFIDFPPPAQLGGPTALWMTALWLNFATAVHLPLGWMQHRLGLAAVLGALAGPAAYFAGAKLGAVTFPYGVFFAMLAVGVVWLIATPLLFLIARILDSDRASTPRESQQHAASNHPQPEASP